MQEIDKVLGEINAAHREARDPRDRMLMIAIDALFHIGVQSGDRQSMKLAHEALMKMKAINGATCFN